MGEKSGSSLSANEQLMRLNKQFPEFNIQCVFQTYTTLLSHPLSAACIGHVTPNIPNNITCPFYQTSHLPPTTMASHSCMKEDVWTSLFACLLPHTHAE